MCEDNDLRNHAEGGVFCTGMNFPVPLTHHRGITNITQLSL